MLCFRLLIEIQRFKQKWKKIKVHTARDSTANKSEKTTLSKKKLFKGFVLVGTSAIIIVI